MIIISVAGLAECAAILLKLIGVYTGDGIPVAVRKHGSAPGTQAIDRGIFLLLICHIHGFLFSERFRGMAVVNVYNQHGETGVADAAF